MSVTVVSFRLKITIIISEVFGLGELFLLNNTASPFILSVVLAIHFVSFGTDFSIETYVTAGQDAFGC